MVYVYRPQRSGEFGIFSGSLLDAATAVSGEGGLAYSGTGEVSVDITTPEADVLALGSIVYSGTAAISVIVVSQQPAIGVEVQASGGMNYAGVGRIRILEDNIMLKCVYLSIVGNLGGKRYHRVGPEVVTDVFPKRATETLRYAVSVAEVLAEYGETLDVGNPVQFGAIPAGITLVNEDLDHEEGYLTLTVSGGRDTKTYPITLWFNTYTGLKIEHQVLILVRDVNRNLQG